MSEAYPLSWPDGWKRTPLTHRRYNGAFKGDLVKYRRHMLEQLRMMGATDVIISTNRAVRRDGQFYGDAKEPLDGGVAIYFKYQKKPMTLACDLYLSIRENMHAIGLTLESIRGIERHGASQMMERAFRGFTALPEQAGQYWRDILGFSQEQKITGDDVEVAFRRLAHAAHPDKGGNVEQWHQLVLARENARRDLGVTR